MSYTPRVSIITIAYNGEKYIEQTIQNVIGQTYPNIEYILIDGGSTDNTISIIKKYEDSIAYWVSEKDKGISDAFNKGLLKATGDIIGIINADDWYEKDAVQKVVDNIGDHDIAYGDLQLLKQGNPDFVIKGDDSKLKDVMTVNHPTVFVKKEVYDKFGLFDNALTCAMDYDLMLRFKVNNCRFKYIPSVLANMRWEGTSDKNWLQGCRETLQIKNKYLPRRKLYNALFFLKHVTGIAIPKYLEKAHLSFFVKAYRKRFAAQKKVYN